ncbi:chromosome partitioning protein [Duganella sp. SG902]|uniref:ParA family protein n=1 Tax=Duganella sp. SG902 TaxID=2587016 RepID=UPI00159E32CC|nr:ParA family protein [Duganella sp. SG902]NVM75829.1 chromosome partitioning protein [Duganella sp. SG902]
MKRVIFNQKGGVGKSTIAVNLAAIAASQGKRTLLIDIDPQCNASRYVLGATAHAVAPTLGAYFEQVLSFSMFAQPPGHYVHPTPFENLSIIVAHAELGDLQSKLESRNKIYKLRDLLRELGKEYDEIFVDTPPAYNFFSQSALIAADSCLIPFDCDDFSRQALYALMNNIKEIKADHNADLKIEGIVVNQFQPRALLPQRMVEQLKEEGLPVFASKLSSSIRIRESHERNLPMVHLDRGHKLSQEYLALYGELRADGDHGGRDLAQR